ncbi:MAG: hypothetical protein KatS3mg105_4092 [Gemmatales bacterium]|nr:MAG: hypothetical protein KatS3mg105_4092 [Gemmatales bacterium]
MPGFLAQLALITFVVHIRSTTVWQFVVILLAIFSSIAVAFWKKRTRSDATTSLQAISCAAAALFGLMAGYLGLCLYRSTAFPEEYKRGEQIMTRVTWHNIFSGLAFHPRLARDFQIQLDDASIIRATGKYLVAHGEEMQTGRRWGGKSPRFTGMRWTPYDRAVRDLLIDTFCRRPWDCIVAMAYYKPVALVKNLAWLYGVRRSPSSLDLLTSPTVGNIVKSQVIQATERLDAQGLRQGPWTPMALVMMGLFAFPIRLVPESRHVGFAVLFLLFGSLIPVLVGYPVPHTIAEIGIMAGVTFHFLLITQFLHRRQ